MTVTSSDSNLQEEARFGRCSNSLNDTFWLYLFRGRHDEDRRQRWDRKFRVGTLIPVLGHQLKVSLVLS